ncbi:MAG TPA: serine hydrolase domain-containing protein [Actinophytocola sp.]|uniref:serine hydrolase domain-containing protein n=1 Tax=Actinophytocola sp. TaxID=1872138 RepID=UPI002DDD7546|nr:serine hydrolase domain-containing protein [Actinophytocola sp.]HEV2782470.1 serine hydrolase domain-containing protein [Actinophytocola sp.]
MRGRALLVLGTVLAVSASGPVAVTAAEPESWPGGRFDRQHHGFAPAWTGLRTGTPEQAGLDPAPIAAALDKITEWTRVNPATGHPLFSGAVALLAHDGVVVSHTATGQAVRYGDGTGTELPAEQQVPMRPDTIFDMASVTKLFTSIAVLQLHESGRIDVAERVSTYLPEFGVNGKESITVQQLLTHTSGLVAWLPLWRDHPDVPARIKAVMDVAPINPPGSTYLYSDLNLIALGVLIERVSGSTLDTYVRQRITEPLGLADTGFNPPASKLDRIAATEYMTNPPRGMVRGSVHDENAWSFGGVAGHAGIFSTAGDLAVLAQTILNGGSYAGRRIMRPETVRMMLTNYNQQFPGHDHGLGFELNQRWYMGGLAGPRTAGHTGFTGTVMVIDPASRSFAVLLTNRVHPSRSWGSINLARETVALGLAKSLAVLPKRGPDAWYTGIGDASSATLTTAVLHSVGPVRVNFAAFVDTEDTDRLVLESSTDGVSWQAVPVLAEGPGAPSGPAQTLSGAGHRSWWTVHAEVPQAAEITLRWRFTTDSRYTGRGVYLDAIRVTDGDRPLLNGEKQPHMLHPQEWQLKSR